MGEDLGRFVREMARVRPGPVGFVGAGRAAGVLLVPLITLWALGRLEWGIYATFGAFAAVYGGKVPFPGRWRVQAGAGVVLTVAAASGALVAAAGRQWAVVVLAAAWAAGASALSDRYHWVPPGPFFAVFAFTACASIPGAVGSVVPAAGFAGGTAALAVLLERLERRREGRPPRVHHPGHRQRVQQIRCAVAVLVAGTIATLLDVGHPYWAMVAAVVPLSAHTYPDQVMRGLHRTVGTVLGLLVAGGLLALHLPTLAVVLLVPVLQGVAELLVTRNYGLALVVITPLALLAVDLAHPQPTGPLLRDRLVETAIGVAVGLTLAVLTRDRTEHERVWPTH